MRKTICAICMVLVVSCVAACLSAAGTITVPYAYRPVWQYAASTYVNGALVATGQELVQPIAGINNRYQRVWGEVHPSLGQVFWVQNVPGSYQIVGVTPISAWNPSKFSSMDPYPGTTWLSQGIILTRESPSGNARWYSYVLLPGQTLPQLGSYTEGREYLVFNRQPVNVSKLTLVLPGAKYTTYYLDDVGLLKYVSEIGSTKHVLELVRFYTVLPTP